ncbi:MAG TPA: hypothetical protein VHL34_09560 [Rhizomicrobium sp.]|jgi:hypothetical protein|nr:hypothetical protein [Rhizomicrobium sp.]
MTTFADITRDAETDEAILGLILVGSRGKGFENEHSDHDAILIVQDDAAAAIRARYADVANMDLMILTSVQFDAYAAWDSPMSWDRYNFAHTKLLVDKTGALAACIAEKGAIPEDKRKSVIDARIDAYVNGSYRSVKCIRNGNALGAHLEASNAMLDLIALVFALNGCHAPFYGYLEKELAAYPLAKLPLPREDFLATLRRVLESADLQAQQALLTATETLCRSEGRGAVFDRWDGKDKWAMTFAR